MIPDHVNAVFEGGGGFLLLLNTRQLLRDKSVRGVHWGPVAFWSAWGWWNVYYYVALSQPLSFFGGVGVVIVNTLNLVLMLRYWRRPLPARYLTRVK